MSNQWKQILFQPLTRKQLHLLSWGYLLFSIALDIVSFKLFPHHTVLIMMAGLYAVVYIRLKESREEITGGRILIEGERCIRVICRFIVNTIRYLLSLRAFCIFMALFFVFHLIFKMSEPWIMQHVSPFRVFVMSEVFLYWKSLLILLGITAAILEFSKRFYHFLVRDKLVAWLYEAEKEGVDTLFFHSNGTRFVDIDKLLDDLSKCDTEKAIQLYWSIKRNARLYACIEFLPAKEKPLLTLNMLDRLKATES